MGAAPRPLRPLGDALPFRSDHFRHGGAWHPGGTLSRLGEGQATRGIGFRTIGRLRGRR